MATCLRTRRLTGHTDSLTHSHTIKPPMAGVQLVGYTHSTDCIHASNIVLMRTQTK